MSTTNINQTAPAADPIARVAVSSPAWLGRALTVAGRLAGAAFAVLFALESESYERTVGLTAAVAAITLVTLVPVGGRLLSRLQWLAAGLLVFSGALLVYHHRGWLMIAAGAVTVVGAALEDRRLGQRSSVAFFYLAFVVTAAIVAVTVFMLESV